MFGKKTIIFPGDFKGTGNPCQIPVQLSLDVSQHRHQINKSVNIFTQFFIEVARE